LADFLQQGIILIFWRGLCFRLKAIFRHLKTGVSCCWLVFGFTRHLSAVAGYYLSLGAAVIVGCALAFIPLHFIVLALHLGTLFGFLVAVHGSDGVHYLVGYLGV